MSHLALYRKYRPQTFSELVGQESIAKTLGNALVSDRLRHAYLFCGPRGTGKTTIARLLAKSLNCEKGVSPNPCGVCTSCQEITQGAALDVIEIDAASNRGVEDVRALREQVRFAAVSGRHKIYIIDEAHQLTNDAVNALLKTLEEPPANVVFVLATTEAHKVLPTIVSRCQRFDFQRIPTPLLIDRMRYVARQENLVVSDDILVAIARRAAGGLRDALTLLDQVSSLRVDGEEIPLDVVHQLLGLVGEDHLLKLTDGILDRDPMAILTVVRHLLAEGFEPGTIVRELLTHVRHLLVLKSAPQEADRLEVPLSRREALTNQASRLSIDGILSLISDLIEANERIRRTGQTEIWLEASLLDLLGGKAQALPAPEAPLLPKPPITITKELSQPIHPEQANGKVTEPITPEEPVVPPPAFKIEVEVPPTVFIPEEVVEEPESLMATQPPTGEAAVEGVYPKFLEMVREKSPATFAFLQHAQVMRDDSNGLTLRFAMAIHKEQVEKKLQPLLMVLKKVAGQERGISLELGEVTQGPPEIVEEKREFAVQSAPTAKPEAEDSPRLEKERDIVDEAIHIFKGKLI